MNSFGIFSHLNAKSSGYKPSVILLPASFSALRLWQRSTRPFALVVRHERL
jgi:hypothetical protein